MIKLTLVTDAKGKLIAAVQGHELSHKHDGVEAHVTFAHGHKLHKIEADIDLEELQEAEELETKLARHIPKH